MGWRKPHPENAILLRWGESSGEINNLLPGGQHDQQGHNVFGDANLQLQMVSALSFSLTTAFPPSPILAGSSY